MQRCTRALCFTLTSALVAACSSGGSGGIGTGGSGTAGDASGGQVGSGGVSAIGGASPQGGDSSLAGAGSSAIGGASAGASGGKPTTGGSLVGGTSAGGSGGKLTTGGASAIGGTSASTMVGGSLSTGGVSVIGGSKTTGGQSSAGGSVVGGSQNPGGASGSGGARSSGGATGGTTGGTVSTAKCPDSTWKLSWGDDFEGAAGSAVDSSKWAYDSGPNWYNNELQYYASGNANASLDGSGNLVIEARKEAREGRQYTSARLKTEGKKTFTYGRIEGRMKMPYGQGMWPAFWMLGGNNWPNGGEIDIMENLGKEPSISHGSMHGPGYSGASGPTATYTLPDGAKFSDDFHVFAIEWETDTIRWYVDGNLFSTKTKADTKGGNWVFDHGFFIILNLAVGGDWPGAPDSTTVFPQKFVIDYVHVCQK